MFRWAFALVGCAGAAGCGEGKEEESGPKPVLAEALRSFQRMYRSHAAREDTVLFPAFREVVGASAYRELSEQFEEQEHQRFGERGFENTVGEIARLEAALEIADLGEVHAVTTRDIRLRSRVFGSTASRTSARFIRLAVGWVFLPEGSRGSSFRTRSAQRSSIRASARWRTTHARTPR